MTAALPIFKKSGVLSGIGESNNLNPLQVAVATLPISRAHSKNNVRIFVNLDIFSP